jgi:hypothetical protein
LKPAVRKAPDPRLENRRCNEHNPLQENLILLTEFFEGFKPPRSDTVFKMSDRRVVEGPEPSRSSTIFQKSDKLVI